MHCQSKEAVLINKEGNFYVYNLALSLNANIL